MRLPSLVSPVFSNSFLPERLCPECTMPSLGGQLLSYETSATPQLEPGHE
jgi:hypothetical protein